MGHPNIRYFLAGLGSFIIWGFFSIPLKNLHNFSAEQILYYRIFTALFFLWLIIVLFRKKELKGDLAYFSSLSRPQKKQVSLLLTLASVFLTLNWFTFIYAINNVSLTSAAFAYMVCPLLTAFGGYLILKEELSVLKLFSLGVALVSIVFLATGSLREVLWSVVIAVFYAIYLIIQRAMQGFDKLNVLAVQVAIAVVIMFPFYIYQYEGIPLDSWFWGNIVVIAVVFTIIPLFLNLYALIRLPSSTLGIMIYINPIIAFAVAVVYYNAHISSLQVYAYLLLLFSVFLFNWQMIKNIFTPKEKTNT